MKTTRDNNDALIAQLKSLIAQEDSTIELAQSRRSAAITMLETLTGNQIESKNRLPKKPKPKGSMRGEIFETIAELVKEYQRPVNLDEILQALSSKGVKIGKNDTKRRSYLGAVFSYELKKENPKIVRSERGTYDIKK